MNRLGAVYMMTVSVGLGMGAAAFAQTSEPFLFGTHIHRTLLLSPSFNRGSEGLVKMSVSARRAWPRQVSVTLDHDPGRCV